MNFDNNGLNDLRVVSRDVPVVFSVQLLAFSIQLVLLKLLSETYRQISYAIAHDPGPGRSCLVACPLTSYIFLYSILVQYTMNGFTRQVTRFVFFFLVIRHASLGRHQPRPTAATRAANEDHHHLLLLNPIESVSSFDSFFRLLLPSPPLVAVSRRSLADWFIRGSKKQNDSNNNNKGNDNRTFALT